mgnify:CR=1 FL=1
MPHLITLRGRNALSEFRTRKLNDLLVAARFDIAGLSAEYRHFVSVTRELTAAEREVLDTPGLVAVCVEGAAATP